MITIYAGLKDGSKHINLKDFEGATAYEYEAEHGPHMSSSWWVLDGDEVRAPNEEELQVREDAADLITIDQLKHQCLQYQSHEMKIDSNFYGLLMAGKASGNAGEKTLKVLLALDLLWSLYETYKKDPSIEVEYDVAGVTPHSFDEIRAEIEA